MISLIINNLYIPQITSKQNTLLYKHSAPVLTVDEIILHPPHLGNAIYDKYTAIAHHKSTHFCVIIWYNATNAAHMMHYIFAQGLCATIAAHQVPLY